MSAKVLVVFLLVISGTISAPVSDTCGLGHDYGTVLRLSNLFYKAQRSGKLPDNDIPWRRSAFTPLTQDGVNLEGGYFDAGDFSKFGFPGAAVITVLAWGMVDFADGYKYAGLYDLGLETLKWQTDYFLRANTGSPGNPVFYAQCGDGSDHSFWGRPEDYKGAFPCFKLDKTHPGTEVAAETAAALAASSMAFKSSDAAYSQTLLTNAKELYEFGKNYKGKYTDSIPSAGNFYKSYSGYYDELALAAVWLYRATQDGTYLSEAENHWNQVGDKTPSEFSWENKGRAVALLLSKFSKSPTTYKANSKQFCVDYLPKRQTNGRGTVFINRWGSNRHAGNVAFICLVYAKYHNVQSAKEFGKNQINSLLGDKTRGIRSYVVGYGFKPPVNPHHRASSCQLKSVKSTCDWNDFSSGSPNPQVLEGALVGGPENANEGFVDSRRDYIRNEVAIDYNAGFQSALAGVLNLQKDNNC